MLSLNFAQILRLVDQKGNFYVAVGRYDEIDPSMKSAVHIEWSSMDNQCCR